MAGKGDKRRPTQVDHETYSDNYDRIFSTETPFQRYNNNRTV